jgi:hypothetical protein
VLAGRNQEAHELLIVFVVGGIELAPAIQLIDIGLAVIEQFTLPPAKSRRLSR